MTCPICNKPSVKEYTPFCCKRCADVDLGKWLTGSYAVPVVEEDDDLESGAEPGENEGET
jgi:uncharacterized protein